MKTLMIILTAMFTAAKLAGAITWSRWLVMSPVLIYIGFYLLIFLFAIIASFIMSFYDSFEQSYKKEKHKADD